MKKTLIAAVLILCILFVGCFDIQFGGSPKGRWMQIAYWSENLYPNDSLVISDKVTYDPEIDNYYDALILKITDDQLISYGRGRNFPVQAMASYDINIVKDTVFCFYNESHSDSFFFYYYFNDDKQLVLIEGDINHATTENILLQKFNGDLPFESWENPIGDDDYEADNNLLSATNITFDEIQSHTITENDTDYYQFQAEEGQAYLIQALAYFGMEIELLDQEGNTLIMDKDNDQRILDLEYEVESVIAWECDASGTYYVKTQGEYFDYSGSTGEGYYKMLIKEIDINNIDFYEPLDDN